MLCCFFVRSSFRAAYTFLSLFCCLHLFDVWVPGKGGPAAQSNKILQNDVLLDVDGHAIVGKPLFEIQSMLAGEVHSPVTMTFARLYGNPSNQTSQQVILVMLRGVHARFL